VPATTGPVVHVQDPTGITAIGLAGGQWDAPGGVATPDWSTIFTISGGVLRTLDGTTGAVRSSQPVPAGLRPIVASADGRFVALGDTPVRIGQSVFPPGRTRSTIVVAPSSPGTGVARSIELDGNIVPEAFSTDRTQLFVIEFLPPAQPDRYRVRSLDIATGRVGPVFTFDKTVDTEVMQGLSRTQAFATNRDFGPMLYTLYSRAGGPAPGYADLHALSLGGGFVHCTDFPAALRVGPEGGAIAVPPDGQRVYVADRGGSVAEVDATGSGPQPFPIARTSQLPVHAQATVALAADDRSVWVGAGSVVFELDRATLGLVKTIPVDQAVDALTVSAGGALFVATSSSVERIDAANGTIARIATIAWPPTRIAVT
jgi:hypothetical protein